LNILPQNKNHNLYYFLLKEITGTDLARIRIGQARHRLQVNCATTSLSQYLLFGHTSDNISVCPVLRHLALLNLFTKTTLL